MSFFSKWISKAAKKGLCHELNFKVPWGHIAAKAWGHPDGRPVLCLHGWADNANTFDRLIPLLPEEFYYVALDFPGHGISSHRSPGIPYYFTEYVTDVRRVTDSLNWNRFSILGHSMGGNVGAFFSSVFSEMVDKLIILDGYGFYPIPANTQQSQLQKGIDELIKLEKEQGPPRVYTPDGALKSLFHMRKDAEEIYQDVTRAGVFYLRLLQGNETVSEESGKILLQRGSTEVPGGLIFTRDLRINLTTPVRITVDQCLELLKNITAAVLMISAKDGLLKQEKWDPNKPPFSLILEGYQTHCDQFRLEQVEGNHHVHLNEPEQVAGIISEFLKMNISSKL